MGTKIHNGSQTGSIKKNLKKHEFTNWENILITKNKDCIMNFEIPPANYLTRSLS